MRFTVSDGWTFIIGALPAVVVAAVEIAQASDVDEVRDDPEAFLLTLLGGLATALVRYLTSSSVTKTPTL